MATAVSNDTTHTDSPLFLAKRELKARDARDNLRSFIEYCMPDPKNYFDPDKTRYECCPHHELLIDLFVRTCEGELLRTALSIPPQHGKSTIFGLYGLAWWAAKNPEKKIIYGTYSEARAGIVGEAVRNIMESDRFKDVFPEFQIRKGASSKYFIGFGNEGSIMFVGRNSGASGNPCDLFVIDDPYKSEFECRSSAVRAEVWSWYCSVVEARCPIQTPIAIIHTRWNDDDLIGHLCDPNHPSYSADDNDEFYYLNIPAEVKDPKMAEVLGMEPGGALWPISCGKPKWPLEILHRIKKKNPKVYSALFMGDPVPPEGDFFTMAMIKPYKSADMPKEVRKYGASDHAVSTSKRADHTVMGIGCVDAEGELWIHKDLIWGKYETDKQVEKLADMMERHAPMMWWAEGDHIKKSLGPFLRKHLRKRGIFKTVMQELTKIGDKQQKAQAIRVMMSMGMVHLPSDATWYQDAVNQLLRFDGSEGRADDFVDFLANLGRGLDIMIPAAGQKKSEIENIKTGTAAWVKMAAKLRLKQENAGKSFAGW